MSGARVTAALRSAVQIRAGGCCEYCGVNEDDAFEGHEADHVIAEQHGGETTSDNCPFKHVLFAA